MGVVKLDAAFQNPVQPAAIAPEVCEGLLFDVVAHPGHVGIITAVLINHDSQEHVVLVALRLREGGIILLLAEGICAASPEGSYTCSEDHAASGSWLVNNSNISLHESRMNNALAAFTGATGIPIVLVIVEAEDIF